MGQQLEDVELWQQYLTTGRPVHLRNRLAENNVKLIWEVIHKLKRRERSFDNEDPDDLFQQGFFGLNSAIERFEMREGAYFYKFAYPFVQGRIRGWLRDKSRAIRIPVVKHDIAAKFFRMQRKLSLSGVNEVTLRKVFDALPEKDQEIGFEKMKEVVYAWVGSEVVSDSYAIKGESFSVYDVTPSKEYAHYNPVERSFGQIYREYPELKRIRDRLVKHPAFRIDGRITGQKGKYAIEGEQTKPVVHFSQGTLD
jgi:RNA polymerase sigma factor (sigma-70 family)